MNLFSYPHYMILITDFDEKDGEMIVIHPKESTKLDKYIHWASKETYHFFGATLTKLHSNKMNHIWTQISFNTS